MGGKTSKSTQTISIPPEVLARYNAINARADAVTNRPYQYYTGQFVAPLTATQQAGIANTSAAANMAQPYYGAATSALAGAQQAAVPYYQGATYQLAQGIDAGNQFAGQSASTLNNAQNVGSGLAAQSYANLNNAQNVGSQYAGQSASTLNNAQNVGSQYAGQSAASLNNAQNVGNQFAGQSSNTINAAQSQGAGIQQNALNNLGAAYSSAQPYNQTAGGQYQQGLDEGRGLTAFSSSGTQDALDAARPYQQTATNYMDRGAQAVNPYDLGADQINKYMSPYLQNVLQGTAGLLNQQNQQQQAGQMGNAIRSGAFGGDRSGIAAANLNQQQNLANSKIFSDILNQGYTQALGTAQQQQGLSFEAAQANRAAQQQAVQQALNIGQQGFGQGLAAAQQQGALGQQVFNMGSTAGQNTAALGNQIYNQGTNTATQQSNVGNTLFNQGATTAAQQAALGAQQFGQGATVAEQQAALGQQQFGQGATTAAQQAALGAQQFGQGATVAEQQAALGQQQFGQGATTAAQQAALGAQQFGQGTAASQQAAALGQGIYGMGSATSQQLADLGTGAQGAALAGAGAQLTAGGIEQATQQAENTARYNEFLQAQSLPYQQLNLASNVALGTGTASGSTTTTAQPGGFFSDERLKENIKAVGKTFDGQTIHSYNYKGDPRTQIGLIAQEVQKRHPNAVGLAGGYKTVDYDKATEDAADRGHMAYGGLASAGGSVMPQNAGQGFAGGGVAGFDPAVMQQILAAQQAMYEPLSKSGMYAGGPNAGGGLVPQSEFVARQLMTPAELPRQATGAEQAQSIANLGKTIGELGGEVGAWDWGSEDAKKKIPDPIEKKPDFDGTIKLALGGGTPYNGQGLDIPQEDATAKTYQPMTPASLEKQETGLDKLGKVAKIAGTVASIFSDKRMKENIKPIGKLFDGQIVHSFNYKGDPRTQIGLIAQEVEGHKPHAVGNVHGMKAVDYAKATSSAAKRGHFAMGGDPEEEMDNIPSYEPTGLYHGDNKFVRNLFKSTASGNKNIDLMSGEEGPEAMAEETSQAGIAKMEEPAGLAAAAKEGLPELLQTKKPRSFAKPTGLAPSMGALPKDIMQIARLIHAGEGTGKNPLSSARGPYQMIDSTFAGEFRKNYPDRAKGMSDSEIIALKRSPEGAAISEAMGPRLIANNAKIVERGGFEPDAGNVYLAHFLGPDTAVKVLRADPNEPIGRYVSREAIAANPSLQKNPTVGGTINWARGYMAKQADRLSRERRAAGGLAGRDGYQVGGAPEDDLIPTDVRDMAVAEDMPVDTINPAPEREAPAVPAADMVRPYKAPEVTIPTGVAGNIAAQAEKPMPVAAPAGEDNNFFRGIAKGKATSIIPLLSGIAAMGTAPTRSLGVALAAGLGAGAQAAQGQRAFGIKQGELKVAQQLADAKTMEITKGILEGRYQFLENGQVWDKYSDTFLSADQATIAKAKAFAKGPQEALTATSPAGVPRADYLKANPTAGTVVPKLPTSHTYEADPKNPSSTIYAAAELTPGVMEARAKRDAAEYKRDELYKALSAPGIGADRYSQLSNLYTLATGEFNVENDKWRTTLDNVVATPLKALQEGNTALVSTNANALAPLIEDARTAINIKQNIRELLPNIGTGGPLSPITQALGNGLIQLGIDKNLVDNLVRAPDSSQTQDALAAQLRSYGRDAEATEALRAYGTSGFAAAAAKAVLRHAEKEADAKIAAFNSANSAFQANPLRADVAGVGTSAQSAEFGARYFTKMPPAGSLPKGTVYYVSGQRYVAK